MPAPIIVRSIETSLSRVRLPTKHKVYVMKQCVLAPCSSLATNRATQYEPLSSVWERPDAELIEAMLRFYPVIEPEPILDATYNTGRFWKGSKRQVVSMDINPRYKPMIIADNRAMTG